MIEPNPNSDRPNSRKPGLPLFWFAAITVAVTVGAVGWNALLGQEKEEFSKYVDAKGNISLPDDFETTFVHIGSIAVAPKSDKPVGEIHGTYTRLADLKAFQKDGKFPDGAILVKDVRVAKNAELTTGNASFAQEVKVWFVMVKDAKGRFKDNALWGDGWGWALFNGDDRKKQVATDYRTDCRTCHVPARKQDWIFTQCYPALNQKVGEKPARREGDKD